MNYDLFSQPDPSPVTGISGGYSETSRIAYHSHPESKQRQAERILIEIQRLGSTCLLQLAHILHIDQSTVSGRVNDLIKLQRVKYEVDENGNVVRVFYNGYMRKKIVLC